MQKNSCDFRAHPAIAIWKGSADQTTQRVSSKPFEAFHQSTVLSTTQSKVSEPGALWIHTFCTR